MAGQKKNIEDLKKIYQEFMKIFNGFEFIAFYGTLLGIIRENNFIKNDDDIDLLLLEKDFNNFIEKLKQQEVFTFKILKKSYAKINLLVQCYHQNIGPIDVYLYQEEKQDILIPWDNNLLYAKKDIFPLKKFNFNDFFINLPNNSTNILLQTYGKMWKTPQDKSSYQWSKINTVRKKLVIKNKGLVKLLKN